MLARLKASKRLRLKMREVARTAMTQGDGRGMVGKELMRAREVLEGLRGNEEVEEFLMRVLEVVEAGKEEKVGV